MQPPSFLGLLFVFGGFRVPRLLSERREIGFEGPKISVHSVITCSGKYSSYSMLSFYAVLIATPVIVAATGQVFQLPLRCRYVASIHIAAFLILLEFCESLRTTSSNE
jgi:hypothetical protein